MMILVQRIPCLDMHSEKEPAGIESLVNTDAIAWIEPIHVLAYHVTTNGYSRWFFKQGTAQIIVKASFEEVKKMFGEIFIL